MRWQLQCSKPVSSHYLAGRSHQNYTEHRILHVTCFIFVWQEQQHALDGEMMTQDLKQDGEQSTQHSQPLEEVRKRMDEIFQIKEFVAVLVRCVC